MEASQRHSTPRKQALELLLNTVPFGWKPRTWRFPTEEPGFLHYLHAQYLVNTAQPH